MKGLKHALAWPYPCAWFYPCATSLRFNQWPSPLAFVLFSSRQWPFASCPFRCPLCKVSCRYPFRPDRPCNDSACSRFAADFPPMAEDRIPASFDMQELGGPMAVDYHQIPALTQDLREAAAMANRGTVADLSPPSPLLRLVSVCGRCAGGNAECCTGGGFRSLGHGWRLRKLRTMEQLAIDHTAVFRFRSCPTRSTPRWCG